MVTIVTIGVLGIQGARAEHIAVMNQALRETNTSGKTISVTYKKQFDNIDALIIPGGESTTMSRILQQSGLYDAIVHRIQEQTLPIMGTCAGCVLLASTILNNTPEITPLNAMDIEVERNAFGRQRESFEQEITFTGFSSPYHAVFIRSPAMTKTGSNCTILSQLDKKVIAARQDRFLALSFHPELTDDRRIHNYFLAML